MNNLLPILLACLTGLVQAQPTRHAAMRRAVIANQFPAELRVGLIGEYLFATDASDTSGTGNDWTLVGDASVSGGVVEFDGSGDYLSASSIEDDLSTSYTIMCWARMDTVSANRTFVDSTTRDLSETFRSILWRIIFIQSTGVVRFQIRDASGTSNFVDHSFTTSGVWFHVALVRNGNAVTGYFNGVSVGTESASSIGSHSSSHYNTIGAVKNNGVPPIANYMDGQIDDVRMWSRALSASEINTLYNLRPDLH